MKLSLYILLVLAFSCIHDTHAQQQEAPPNFFEIQKQANAYFRQRAADTAGGKQQMSEEAGGTAQYKRWEWFWQQRVTPDGQFPDPMVIYTATAKHKAEQLRRLKPNGSTPLGSTSARWKEIGPVNPPKNTGAGRVNRVHINPDFPNMIWIGTAAGGAWLSTDNGATWTPKTDGIPSIGVTDVVTTATNPNLVYIATGDGNGNNTIQSPISYSVGVMVSNDGGTTWSPSGLNWSTSNARVISRLLMSPAKPELLIAATSNGIYRTENAGLTWTMVQSGNFRDMEFKPGDPTTLYACARNQIFKSIDEGKSWQALTTGIPNSIFRIALAVTSANPNMVYALCSFASNGTGGHGGFYTSSDAGATWTLKASGFPNIIGSSADGNDDTQQGWYDLALAVSPSNSQEIYAGGVSIWKSLNGGTTWSLNAHGYGASGIPYVHPDIHDLVASEDNSSEVYAGCDGGIVRTRDKGTTWTDLSNGLGIMQFYRISSSANDTMLLIGGSQDNGTNRLKDAQWARVRGGDGMKCLFDPENPMIIYASSQFGNFGRSVDGGTFFPSFIHPEKVGLGRNAAAWLAPLALDPTTKGVVYVGYADVWKYSPDSSKWTKISAFNPGSGYLTYLTVSGNGRYIFAGNQNTVFRSKNAGLTWESLSTAPGKGNISAVATHPTDTNRVWLTVSGYSNLKVFTSNDGGTTWSNISEGLPAIPVNCIVYQKNSPDRLYVGTEAGVYYRDNGTGQWIPYSDGMPNVIVNDLEIHYATGKLRAGTYGRGIWEIDLVNCTARPISVSAQNGRTALCDGDSTILTATPGFVSYLWSTGATTPSITVYTAGSYSVAGIDTGGCPSGSGNTTITTSSSKTATISGSRNGVRDSLACEGIPIILDAGIAPGYSYQWNTGDTTRRITVSTPGLYSVTLRSAAGCSGISLPFTVLSDITPLKPIITSNGRYFDTLIAPAAVNYQWYIDGVAIDGATTQTYIPPQIAKGKKVTVAVFNSGGCSATSDPVVIGANGVENEGSTQAIRIFPNPTSTFASIELTLPSIAPVTIDITAANGATIQTLEFMPNALNFQEKISFKDLTSGAYILTVKCGDKTWIQKVVKE